MVVGVKIDTVREVCEMSVIRDGVKVKKKEFSFPVPELIDHSIDELIHALNTNDSLADCYMSNLYNNINNCLHLDINDDEANELRDYYIRGGMYEDS